MKKKLLGVFAVAIIIIVSLITFPPSATALSLNVVGGQLIGASGVDVGGTLYDVEFVDGTCIGVFDGCDAVSDFAFNTSLDAFAAVNALLDQVFLDGVLGLFHTIPSLTNGCDDSILILCEAVVPYKLDLDFNRAAGFMARNGAEMFRIRDWSFRDSRIFDMSDLSDRTFALFRPTHVTVPEPSTLLLLGSGLAGLGFVRRRFKS